MKCVANTGEVLPNQSVLAGFCQETGRILIISPQDLQVDREWKPTLRDLFFIAGGSQTQWEDTIQDSLRLGTHDGMWRLPTLKETKFLIAHKNEIGANLANPDLHEKPRYWTAYGHFSVGAARNFADGEIQVLRDFEIAAARLVRLVTPAQYEELRTEQLEGPKVVNLFPDRVMA